MNKLSRVSLLMGLAVIGSLSSIRGGSPDGIDLTVSKGPGPDDVTLDWAGGQPGFEVFRATTPEEVGHPLNLVGQTNAYSWAEAEPVSSIFFYLVRSTCVAEPTDPCDGLDNDCDGRVDEDHDIVPTECGLGACEGNTGELLCRNGREIDTCDPFGGAAPDLCDGLDNDCDPDSVDGSGDPQHGVTCDGSDQDLCPEGTRTCRAGSMICTDFTVTTIDLCNGSDDDCDAASSDGTEDPQVGSLCDGTDGDQCFEGTRICSAGVLTCTDNTGTLVDLCNSLDDDCDSTSADGTEDPQVGTSCDGGDGDLCSEGTRICSAGTLGCTDNTTTTVDLCNGLNDDCDAASADGAEDPQLGTPCDGADGDLCIEGGRVCTGGTLGCSDNTGTTNDLCNGSNDDCDAASPDGSEDPQVGQSCDGTDGDQCLEGVRTCTGGALGCTDSTGTTVEVCNGNNFDEDCDGQTDEGFSPNDSPSCASAVVNIGSLAGDVGSPTLNDAGWNEEWDRVTIREDSGSAIYVSATIQLYSPPGVDFDLYVRCSSCGGAVVGSSTVGGLGGHYDLVYVRSDENLFSDDTFDIIIEVRYFSSSFCNQWELTVFGNTQVNNETCN